MFNIQDRISYPGEFERYTVPASGSAATCLLPQLIGVFICLLGALLTAAFSSDQWQSTMGLLLTQMGIIGVMMQRRLRSTADSRLPDFVAFALLLQLAFKVGSAVSLLYSNGVIEADYYASLDFPSSGLENRYLYRAELVFLFGLIVFLSVWSLLERLFGEIQIPEFGTKALWRVYLFFGITFALVIFTELNQELGSLTSTLRWISCGALALLVAGRSPYSYGASRFWISILAWIPHLIFSLQTGTKSDPIMVTLPLLFPLLRQASLKSFLLLLAVLLTALTFLVPFSQELRRANWEGYGNNENASATEVAARVIDSWSTHGISNSILTSSLHMTSRASTSEGGGVVMEVAERDGHIGLAPLEGFWSVFIPRVLWPEKRSFAPGAWFTWYLGGADSPETATTATATYLSTELYWMFGVLGVLFGTVVIVSLNYFAIRFLSRPSKDTVVRSAGIFLYLIGSGGLIETHVFYALTSPILTLVTLIVLGWTLRAIRLTE